LLPALTESKNRKSWMQSLTLQLEIITINFDQDLTSILHKLFPTNYNRLYKTFISIEKITQKRKNLGLLWALVNLLNSSNFIKLNIYPFPNFWFGQEKKHMILTFRFSNSTVSPRVGENNYWFISFPSLRDSGVISIVRGDSSVCLLWVIPTQKLIGVVVW
jgi:hypothetical protein